jgi:hypothetical protein
MIAEGETRDRESSSVSERRRGSCSCRENETFFLIFKGAGARPAPGLLGGAETALLCVGVASDEDNVEQIEDVGEGSMDEEAEERDEVCENTESTDERTEEIEF